jgi:radical SAM superfamily enzyme YgiQ (UPF0313 family)
MSLMEKVQKVRKAGLTFAPEAGSQRLRDVINKNVKEEDLLNSCRIAFEGGWNGVKLYFMLGLPTETDEDVLAIADLAYKVLKEWREHSSNRNRGVKITVSTSCFIPKPHTPFQWEKQVSTEEYQHKVNLLRNALRSKSIHYDWHSTEMSVTEAVLSRGDRRVADALEEIWKDGGKLESWGDYFSYERWDRCFKKCGLTLEEYARRERSVDEILPWDMIDLGVNKSYLKHEREMAYLEKITPDCRVKCTGCGASGLLCGGFCDE